MIRATRLKSGLVPPPRQAFTLVELLVVLLIILLVSAAALPTVLSGLRQRQVGEAARTFQAALGGARDLAISNNAPRGIRLLPDPILTQPPVGSFLTDSNGIKYYNGGSTTWACNRFIPIEPASDYKEGRVTFFNPNWDPTNHPRAWYLDPAYSAAALTYSPSATTTGASVLMLIQSFTDVGGTGAVELTSWAWNLRVGDKIQFESATGNLNSAGTGQLYTIVGPVTQANPEGFINYDLTNGPPTPSGTGYVGPAPEFLLLVNGIDDDADGFVDNGYDGVTSSYETERWLGDQISESFAQAGNPASTPSILRYVAKRRPVPAKGARETLLPANVVIDLTTWNGTRERSRLPIDGISRYIDILVDPTGQVIQSTSFSSPSSYISPFLHLWLTDREGVVEPLWGMNTSVYPWVPNPQPAAAPPATVQLNYMLPMPVGTPSYPTTGPNLQGERMLMTIYARTGNITINSVQNFDATDINTPFYAAQRGAKESP